MKGTQKCQVIGFLEKNVSGREQVQGSLEFTKNAIQSNRLLSFRRLSRNTTRRLMWGKCSN